MELKLQNKLDSQFNIGILTKDTNSPDVNPWKLVNHEFLLRKLSKNRPNHDEHTQVEQYTITTECIFRAIEIQAKENSSAVDNYLNVAARNVHGQFNSPKLSLVDELINKMIRQWTDWQRLCFRQRSTPLLYKCYICSIGWWTLYPFREHITNHQKNSLVYLRLELDNHEFSVVASNEIDRTQKDVIVESNCLKCGRDVSFHCVQDKLLKYKCVECGVLYETCHKLREHERICKESIKLKQEKHTDGVDKAVTCLICEEYHVKQSSSDLHASEVHWVRSDEPMPNIVKTCNRCYSKFNYYKYHECSENDKLIRCKHCSKKFMNSAFRHLHMSSLGYKINCTVCNKAIYQCGAAEHYVEHTNNYTLVYWCQKCKEKVLFTNSLTFDKHMKQHDSSRRKRWGNCMLVPTICLDPKMASNKEVILVPDEKLQNFMLGNDSYNDQAQDEETADAEGEEFADDVIMLDDDDKNLDGNDDQHSKDPVGCEDVDMCEIQAQLDAEIEHELEMEKIIVEMFKKSKSYNTFVEKVIRGKRAKGIELIKEQEMPIRNVIKESRPLTNVVVDSEEESVTKEPENRDPKEGPEDQDEDNCDLVIVEQVQEVTVISDTESEASEGKADEKSQEIEPIVSDEQFTIVKKENYEEVDVGFDTNVSNNLSSNDCWSVKEEVIDIPLDLKEEIERNLKSGGLKSSDLDVDQSILQKPVKRASSEIGLYCACIKKDNNDLFYPQCDKKIDIRSTFKKFSIDSVLRQCTECGMKVKPSQKFCLGNSAPVKENSDEGPFEKFLSEENAVYEEEEDDGPMPVDSDDYPEASMALEVVNKIIEVLRRFNKVLKCVACSKKFLRTNECKRHMIGHLLRRAMFYKTRTNNMLKCPICPSRFSIAEFWKVHVRKHSMMKIFKCPTCSKTFGDTSNLAKHMKTHNNYFLFCDLCNGKFLTKQGLSLHLKLHENAPSVCNVCGVSFITQSRLNNHRRRKHSQDNKSFPCKLCTKRFTSVKEKWDHLWLVHKERTTTADCPRCEKQFRKHHEVLKHLREVHRGDRRSSGHSDSAVKITSTQPSR